MAAVGLSWDSKGYPAGLKGEAIPLGSRIIALCDAIDAMTSERPYRPAFTWHHCWEEVVANKAIQFDVVLVEAIKEKLNLKVRSLPGEGKGMTRKVRRLFKRLDGKIPVHNGLDRFKQESFYSVWHDLKELVLLSR